MLRILPEEIEEFIRLYEAEFQEVLTFDGAYEQASRLLSCLELLIRPLPSEQVLTLEGRTKEG